MAEIIDVVMKLTDNVTDGLRHIKTEMEQTAKANMEMGRNLSNAGRNVSKISSAMMPLAAGIAGVGAVGVKTFMDFDATMTGAAVKAGATTEEMQKMKDAAAQMGAKFPVTANEVAEGMDRLAAGGFDAEQTIGAMPGIIEASIASGEDMATTSDVVTSALSTWNMMNGDIGENTQKVADIIQTANNKSKLGMQDFGLALQYAGGTAASMGVSIEDLSSAMAILSNKGLESSTIGTSLRSTMLNLVNPPKDAADALTQLGLSAADFSDSNGHFIGIQKSVEKLNNAMKDLTPTQKSVYAQMIAGKEASTGLIDLINTDASAYQDMVDSITNSNGSSHEAYLKMQDTLKGSIDVLMSSVEALGISFGSALAPTIRDVAGSLKGVADAFTNMSPESKQMVIHIGEAIVAFTAFTFATSKILGVAGTMVSTYGQIGRVLAGHTIRNKALQYAVLGVAKVLPVLKSGILGIASGFRVALAAMGPVGIAFMVIGTLAAYVITHWETFGPIFSSIWETAVNTVEWAVKGISNFINGIIDTASSLIDFVSGVFAEAWSSAWQGIVDAFSSIFGGIEGIASGVLDGIRAAINAVIDGINSISVDIPDWVPQFGGQHFGLDIPHLYTGTMNWVGGPAVINDRYGGEIVDLPSGARVIPHDQSVNQAYNMGRAGSSGTTITINIGTAEMGSNQDIRQTARKLAEQVLFELETRAINQNVGAI